MKKQTGFVLPILLASEDAILVGVGKRVLELKKRFDGSLEAELFAEAMYQLCGGEHVVDWASTGILDSEAYWEERRHYHVGSDWLSF